MLMKSAHIKFVLVSIMTLLTLAEKSFGAEKCEGVFGQEQKLEVLSRSPAFPQDPATLAKVHREIKNSQAASRFFMDEMQKESEKIKASSRGKVIDVDWLCLGAGPQCAAASLVLGRTPSKSLVLERSDLVAKTFAEKDFYINSIELESLSMHHFPGGLGSLAHHTSQKYAHSTQLAAYIQQQQYASAVPVLLGTALTKAHLVKRGGEVIVEITTNQNITIRAKNLLTGTGLGVVGTKVRDPGYKVAFEADYLKHLSQPDVLFPLMSTDTFLTALKNMKLNGKVAVLPSRIVVVGDGDGSRITIEGMRDPHVRIPKDFHITWVGNDFSTPKQYMESRNGGDRYIHKIVPFYEAKQIQGIPGHLETWSQDSQGKMHLTTVDKASQARFEAEGTLIIDSTGYDPVMPQILKMLEAQPELADVKGPLPELKLTSTVLARQAVSAAGEPLPVFALGASAGPLATSQELIDSPNKNPMAIFNTVPRTSMALSILTKRPPFPSFRGVRTEREAPVSASKMIQEARQKRQEQESASRSRKSSASLLRPLLVA